MSDSIKKGFSRLLKTCLFLIFIYIIYNQLIRNQDIQKLTDEFISQLNIQKLPLLILVLLLTMLNWILESMKWKVMVQKYYPINLRDSIKAILMGLSFGIATPNRLGEFAGRLLMVPREYNMLSAKASLMNSLSQNIATLLFGICALWINKEVIASIGIDNLHLLYFLIPILFGLLIIYILIEWIIRFPLIKIMNEKFSNWGLIGQFEFDTRQKYQVLLFSSLRFLTYCFQFYLVLKMVGIDLGFLTIISSVMIIYLIQSFLPLPPLINLLARGEIGILIFSVYHVNEIAILVSTLFIWIINIAFPAFFGLMITMKTRISESV